jgi:hypothetical protein
VSATRALLLAGALLAGGCIGAPPRARARAPALDAADYPGELRTVEALAADVLWRQRVTAAWGDGERRGFDAAVQKSGDTLTVMGLSPAGSMGFAIVWRNGTLELVDRMPEELPFPPRFVLLDVQRAFYPWLTPASAPPDGVRTGVVYGERIRETWRAGELVERTFERVDGIPAGVISIRYQREHADWIAASRVVLENGWFGYRLEIETHAETRLEPASDSNARDPR